MYPQQLETPSYSWAEACVQAAKMIDKFLQTVNCMVSECGTEAENIDLVFLLLNEWAASCLTGNHMRLQNSYSSVPAVISRNPYSSQPRASG